MMKADVQYKIQKRIGYSIIITLIFVGVYHIFNNAVLKHRSFQQSIASPALLSIIVFIIPAWFSTLKNHLLYRICQVLIFLIMGIIASKSIPPDGLVDVYFFVYAIILGIQYNLFKKFFFLKITIIFILFTIIKLYFGYINYPDKYLNGILSIVFALAFLYLIWIAFAEEIQEYITQTKTLQQKIDQNEIFVSFGKNVSGVTHNLKNKIMAIQSFNELIQESDNSEIQNYGKLQNAVINETYELISSLNLAVKARHDEEQKTLAFNKIIKSVVDLFNSNSQFHKDAVITLDLIDDDFIYISPSVASQIIENLLRNAWEAKKKDKIVNILIKTEHIDKYIKQTIQDDGVGINFCNKCDTPNCLQCKHFQIGRSTKTNGSGIGIIYIRTQLQKLNGKLHIHSSIDNNNTVIELFFPAEEQNIDYMIE